MNRLGITLEEAVAIAPRLQSENHGFTLVMSHLACAEIPHHPMNDRQVRLFREIRILYRGVPSSLANSSGIFLGGGAHCDLVRPGVALYGVNPTPLASVNPSIAHGLRCQIVAVDVPGHSDWAAAYNLAYLTRRAVAAFFIDNAHVVERWRYPDRACLTHRVGAVKQRDEALGDPVNFVEAVRQDAVQMFLVDLMQRRAE